MCYSGGLFLTGLELNVEQACHEVDELLWFLNVMDACSLAQKLKEILGHVK